MKKNMLLRTNIIICLIIILGFILTSIISYQSNRGIYRRDIERVSMLTEEGIYHQIDSLFTKPINISLTMANDQLLKEFLSEEEARLNDEDFLESMRAYLLAYQEKYGYDSVFLVSTKTSRYYHFNGLDRVITPGSEQDAWYFAILDSEDEYGIDIDDDKAANHEITVFVNCKIKSSNDEVMGIVGVGFRVSSIQELLKSYEDQYGVHALLVDNSGNIAISTKQTGYHSTSQFEDCPYVERKDEILANQEGIGSFWYGIPKGEGFLVTQYIPAMQWHLLIENDTIELNQQLNRQFHYGVTVIAAILLLVLLTITRVIQKYNARIVKLTVETEQSHKDVFKQVTEQMYEDIYEVDVTHNRAASEATEAYFESLGVPKNTPFDQVLLIVANRQIKGEFREGYVATLTPEHVLNAYRNGKASLCYDFMITTDGVDYHWMRINARIFHWDEDDSVRMLIYRQNIEDEKLRERRMFDQMQRDSLTGLYNKAATQEYIRKVMAEQPDAMFAFYILDIDNFKQVNDQLGHAMGDIVLFEFANALKSQFREGDIVGRIGGDEFVAFLPIPNQKVAVKKAQDLITFLQRKVTSDMGTYKINASIGLALTPEAGTDFDYLYRNADAALYQSKKKGKNSFSVYNKNPVGR